MKSGRYYQIILKYCTYRLEKLCFVCTSRIQDFGNALSDIFEKFGAGLKHLNIQSQFITVEDLPSFLSGVKKCVNLTSLRLGNNIALHVGLWEDIGSNIESITLYCDYRVENSFFQRMLGEILFFCPELTSIYLGNWFPFYESTRKTYTRFLVLLGEKLVGASLGCLEEEEVVQILRACPDWRCSYEFYQVDLDVMMAMKNNLLDIECALCNDEEEWKDVSNVLSFCTRIENLVIRSSTPLSNAVPLFLYPMLSLKELTLIHCNTFDELISLVRKFTPNLTKLEATCTDIIENGWMFQLVVEALPKLRKLHLEELCGNITSFTRDAKRSDLFFTMVQVFSSCKRIESLQFLLDTIMPSSKEFRTICLPLRLRSIYCGLSDGNSKMKQYQNGRFDEQ